MWSRKPITVIVGCSGRAASGQTVPAPLRRVMNSRPPMCAPLGRRSHRTTPVLGKAALCITANPLSKYHSWVIFDRFGRSWQLDYVSFAPEADPRLATTGRSRLGLPNSEQKRRAWANREAIATSRSALVRISNERATWSNGSSIRSNIAAGSPHATTSSRLTTSHSSSSP
jgi:hypothetical protein